MAHWRYSKIPVAALLAVVAAGTAFAQGQPRSRLTVLDLKLGTPAAAMPALEFMDYACGTNGGPPGMAIGGWSDFARCRPEAVTGLREVYFRYDDELEYVARARRQETQVGRYAGTKVFERAVILGALFDAAGVLRGLRVVSDPRVDAGERKEAAVALSNFWRARYGEENFRCADLPPAEGESALGVQFIKQRCDAVYRNEYRLYVDTDFYRKAGQAEFVPGTRQTTVGQFAAESRFEIYALSVPPAR